MPRPKLLDRNGVEVKEGDTVRYLNGVHFDGNRYYDIVCYYETLSRPKNGNYGWFYGVGGEIAIYNTVYPEAIEVVSHITKVYGVYILEDRNHA